MPLGKVLGKSLYVKALPFLLKAEVSPVPIGF
jgi:hypothetical protein